MLTSECLLCNTLNINVVDMKLGQSITCLSLPRRLVPQFADPHCRRLSLTGDTLYHVIRWSVVFAGTTRGGALSPTVGSFEVRDHLLGKQAHRRGHLFVCQAAEIHVAQEMGHVPGLQGSPR